MRCPICHKTIDPADAQSVGASFAPFCTERCKLIDLGRWLDGKYQIPVPETDPDTAYETHADTDSDD